MNTAAFQAACSEAMDRFLADQLCIATYMEGDGFKIAISRPESEAEQARKDRYDETDNRSA